MTARQTNQQVKALKFWQTHFLKILFLVLTLVSLSSDKSGREQLQRDVRGHSLVNKRDY